MSRHRAPDSADDETTVIPRITAETPEPAQPVSSPRPKPSPTPAARPEPADATAVLPVVRADAAPSSVPTPTGPVPQRPAPTSAAPISPAPVSPAPVSPAPVSAAPVSSQPVSGQPVSGQPVSGQPVSSQPVSSQPVSGQPVADDATATIPRIPAADATATIPRIPAADATAVIPRIDETSLIGKIPDVLPADPSDPAEPGKPPRDRDDSGAPIRAVRRKDVYASAYADYTRVTVGSVIRTTLRTTGELLITCGLVLLLFAAYEVWGKAAIVDSHQSDLNQQLAQAWDNPTPTPSASTATNTLAAPPGDAIARLYIPRLNKHWVVVQGVTPADIRYAPGHYPKSAMPGQDGNFAMAGHRMRSVFWDLDKLQVGDKIVVETRTTWYVYAVVKTRIVKPTQVEVVSPNPPEVKAAAKSTNDKVTPGNPTVSLDRFLTLTTCNPKWDNYQRLIIHAALVDGSERPRADGPPAELKG